MHSFIPGSQIHFQNKNHEAHRVWNYLPGQEDTELWHRMFFTASYIQTAETLNLKCFHSTRHYLISSHLLSTWHSIQSHISNYFPPHINTFLLLLLHTRSQTCMDHHLSRASYLLSSFSTPLGYSNCQPDRPPTHPRSILHSWSFDTWRSRVTKPWHSAHLGSRKTLNWRSRHRGGLGAVVVAVVHHDRGTMLSLCSMHTFIQCCVSLSLLKEDW